MATCTYDVIDSNIKTTRFENINKPTWNSLLRQLFVISGVWSIYFVLGLGFGAPTVMIAQIRRDANSIEAVSKDMASWLSSVHGYSALPWVFIITLMTKYLGRRIPFLLVCINTLVGFIIFYCSKNTTHLLVSAIMQGMLLASNITLFVVIVTEYSSPRYRGVFMVFKSMLFFLGVWVANATGTFFHWKNISIIAFVCSIYSLSAAFWPESPYWLAMKGRFDECIASHNWLKGIDKDSHYELDILISSQKDYLKNLCNSKSTPDKGCLKNVVKMVKTKAFYMPMLLTMSIMSMYHFSGKLVCSMYAIDVMNQITGDEYISKIGMLIMDFVTIVGMLVGCVLSKFVNRRTMLLSSSAAGIIFLFIISAYLFLIRYSVFTENRYISVTLLTLFSVCISMGPMIMAATLFGELVSMRHMNSSLLILTLFSEFMMATILKISPNIFETLTLPGAFLFYGLSASMFLLILYKYLPETKDKTLVEIENFFKGSNSRSNTKENLI